jgi:heme-degrading monooxygenase HmoA
MSGTTTTRRACVYARATTYRGSPEDVQEAVVHYQEGIPSVREISGNQGAFLLVDRAAGKGVGVTLWESEEAMLASRTHADELQHRAQESTGESVHEYEVAVWAVS